MIPHNINSDDHIVSHIGQTQIRSDRSPPQYLLLQVFRGRKVPDLCDMYDLYDLAHVAGWRPFSLHDLAHVAWVGHVPQHLPQEARITHQNVRNGDLPIDSR